MSLVSYANHDLKRLDLQARLRESPGTQTAVPQSDVDAVGEADFTLPLTTYLGPRTLQFQVAKTGTSNRTITTPLARVGPYRSRQGRQSDAGFDRKHR